MGGTARIGVAMGEMWMGARRRAHAELDEAERESGMSYRRDGRESTRGRNEVTRAGPAEGILEASRSEAGGAARGRGRETLFTRAHCALGDMREGVKRVSLWAQRFFFRDAG